MYLQYIFKSVNEERELFSFLLIAQLFIKYHENSAGLQSNLHYKHV